MKRAGIILLGVVLFEGLLAYAGDCSVSKKFRLKKSQGLTGVLQDPVGTALSGVTVDLLSGNAPIRSLRTDDSGRYDFGNVSAGEYKVRVGAHSFCAPKVNCRKEGCILEPRLRLDPKNQVTVVY
jgi:hypothetical protein